MMTGPHHPKQQSPQSKVRNVEASDQQIHPTTLSQRARLAPYSTIVFNRPAVAGVRSGGSVLVGVGFLIAPLILAGFALRRNRYARKGNDNVFESANTQ